MSERPGEDQKGIALANLKRDARWRAWGNHGPRNGAGRRGTRLGAPVYVSPHPLPRSELGAKIEYLQEAKPITRETAGPY